MNRTILTLVIGLVLIISGCTVKREHVDYVEILSRIEVGDERQEAINKLSDAWLHAECPFDNGAIEDIFFYGPRERDSVDLIMISILSEPKESIYRVTRTGTYESYFLDAPDFGQGCQPPVQDIFD